MAAWMYDQLSFSAQHYPLRRSCPTTNRHLAATVIGIVALAFMCVRLYCWKYLGVMNRSAKVQVQGGVLAYQGMVLEVETELVALV